MFWIKNYAIVISIIILDYFLEGSIIILNG